MSRSFHPPNTLTKEEIRTIADVRRDIWTNGFYGMAYGSLTGITGHTIMSALAHRQIVSIKLNRNTAMLSFLLGASLGSFLMASTTGKNQVHNLHPIFDVGAVKPYGSSTTTTPNISATGTPNSPYQQSIEMDAADRLRNRGMRRETLKKALEKPNGLNDSHGGRWVKDANDDGRHDNRMLRRKTLKKTLENPNGLNDSHGGRWVNDSGTQDKHLK